MSPKKDIATKKIASSSTKNRKKKTENERYINPKNYLYALLILVGGILLAFYIFSWYQVKQEEKYMNSYLINSNTISSSIKDLDSFNQIKQEFPSSYFIYVGYTNDENVYNLEKNLKRVIDKYKLNDIFYYIDLTELKDSNENYLMEARDKLGIDELENIPAIIYINEGEITVSNVLDGVKGTMLKAEDFEQLLDIYEFEPVD